MSPCRINMIESFAVRAWRFSSALSDLAFCRNRGRAFGGGRTTGKGSWLNPDKVNRKYFLNWLSVRFVEGGLKRDLISEKWKAWRITLKKFACLLGKC